MDECKPLGGGAAYTALEPRGSWSSVEAGENRGGGGVVSLDVESGCVELNKRSVAASAAVLDVAAATAAAAAAAAAAAPNAAAAAAISAAAAAVAVRDGAVAGAISAAAAAAAARSTRSRSAAEEACHGVSRVHGSGDVEMCRRSGPEQLVAQVRRCILTLSNPS